jgi:anaerobic magnesium-protoporphyrin IX monomethyl ester cyclase
MSDLSKIKIVLANVWSIPIKTPHFGLMSLAAYAREKIDNLEIQIIESEDPFEEILKAKPDIIGFASDTLAFLKTQKLAKKVKNEISCPILIGGVHITALPNSFEKCFDVAIIGEAENTFVELLKCFLNMRNFISDDLEKIKGIMYWQDGKKMQTERADLIADIDKLPLVARDLVPMEEYYLKDQFNLFGVKKLATLVTSRGCPYKCIFCGSPVQWGRVRWHSPEYVVDEIEFLFKKYKVDGIMFWDDLFIAPKERLRKIVELIKERGLDKKLTFFGYARANLIDGDVCKLLKSINTRRLIFGFETGSQKILNYLKKNSVSIEDNMRTVELCRKYDITTSSGYIIGTPGENVADLVATYKFMKKYPLDNTQVYILTPYPGTELWQDAEKKGLVSDKMDFNSLYVQLPVPGIVDYIKTERSDLLKGRIFLNKEFENNKDYISLIYKIIKLAYVQNIKFYFKALPKNLDLVKRIVLSKVKKIFR